MPSILSAVSLIFISVSTIACTYTEYRMAEELFANEGKENYAVFSFGLIVCAVICGLTICIFMYYYDNFPLVELLACHKQINSDFDNTPRIPYSTFKKMYKLHPENFQFIDNECFTFYSFRYRDKRFSLNFLDFVRALSLVDEHITEKDLARERAKRVEKCEEQAKLYAMMRDDLASDLTAIEKQKTDAYDKIKTYLCYYEYFRYGNYNCMYRTMDRGYFFNGQWSGEPTHGTSAKVLAWTELPAPPTKE